MSGWIELVGENSTLQVLGIKLVGMNAENGAKLLFSLALLALIWALRAILEPVILYVQDRKQHAAFWLRQGVRLGLTLLLVVGLLSLWFDEPTRLATAMGLVSAGLAFALQRVITAIAGYIVILRGRTFNVGDRITMGGVRGDVVALNFIQTTIMEMGQPPSVQNADPAMWVRSRQYTGRIVKVSNDKIFDTPVFNYTEEFPYIWEEMTLPVSYKDNRHLAEQILLDAAEAHTAKIKELSESDLRELERRYGTGPSELAPRVYWRITDNWLELTVRFIAKDRDIRALKDAMSRDILANLDAANIGIASTTLELVGPHLVSET